MRLSERSVGSEEIAHAASVVARGALRLAPHQRLLIFADYGSRDLATALHAAARDLRARGEIVWLDPYRASPLKVLPEDIIEQLGGAQASVFLASARTDELSMRQHLLHLVAVVGLRHVHMPGISRPAFAQGMRCDPKEMVASGRRLLTRLRGAERVEVTSPQGTALELTFDAASAWFSQLGALELGRWCTLPAGALHATPASIEGVFVADASIGEFFGVREGLLRDKPVRFEIRGGRITNIDAPAAPALARDIASMMAIAPDANRVGVVTVGVNSGIETATGEASVDQNLPGLHIGVGDPAARAPAALWTARTAFSACGEGATVSADGEILIDGGKVVCAEAG